MTHSPLVVHGGRSRWCYVLPFFPPRAPATQGPPWEAPLSLFLPYRHPLCSVWNSFSSFFLFESYSSLEAVGAAPSSRSLILTAPLDPSHPASGPSARGLSCSLRNHFRWPDKQPLPLIRPRAEPSSLVHVHTCPTRDYCFPFYRLKKQNKTKLRPRKRKRFIPGHAAVVIHEFNQ